MQERLVNLIIHSSLIKVSGRKTFPEDRDPRLES